MATAETNRRDGLLWLGTLGPPFINLVQLTFNFAVARHACKAHTTMPMWIGSGVALAITIVLCALSWSAAREPLRTGIKIEHDRPRMLAMAAIGACGFGLMVTVALAIPHLILNPCD